MPSGPISTTTVTMTSSAVLPGMPLIPRTGFPENDNVYRNDGAATGSFTDVTPASILSTENRNTRRDRIRHGRRW